MAGHRRPTGEATARAHAEVNLGRIERYAQEDETVVVPGKVLGSGVLEKNVTVAAVDFSRHCPHEDRPGRRSGVA